MDKQIRELATEILQEFTNCYSEDDEDCLVKIIHKYIPEGAVVLTKEEYEKLKQYEEKVKSGACFTQKEWLELCDEECKRNTENLSKARQLERKETAEKLLDEIDYESNGQTKSITDLFRKKYGV